jgi:hypothetical protein
MALDDFLTEDTEPVQPVELDSAASSDDGLDEDLFDFPAPKEDDEASVPVEVSAAIEPSAETALAMATESEEDLHDPTFEESAGDEAAETPAEPIEQALASPAKDEGEIDLDEDLYDFADPDADCIDDLVSLGDDLEEILSEVSGRSTAEELDQLASAAEVELELTFAPENTPATTTSQAPTAPIGATAEGPPVSGGHAQLLRQQPAWVAIASVIVANFILLFFAWSASRSLHAHLTQVRDEIRQQPAVIAGVEPMGAAPVEAPVATDLPIDEQPSESPAENVTLPSLPSEEEISLQVAEREIADERFDAARRRLYGLLARVDALDAGTRDTIEARALYLIGDAYAQQAAIGEGRL